MIYIERGDSMKIMVSGIGGVGGYIASVLCANYIDVTLVARRARKEALEKQGLVLYSDFFGDHTFHPAVTDTPAAAGIQDVIFVCVKNYSLEAALTALRPCVGDHTIIVLILNGVDHSDVARHVLPKGILVDSAIYITSAYDKEYAIHQHGKFTRVVLGGANQDAVDTVYDLLNHPGITCKKTDDIEAELWNKYILNCAYNVLTAYYECTIGDIMGDDQKKQEFYTLLSEAYTVGKALGVHLDPRIVDTLFGKIVRQDAKDGSSSLARDVIAGRQSELETFSGYLVKTADRLHVQAPFSKHCYTALLQRTQNKR